MRFRKRLAEITGLKQSILPDGYQAVGDIALLKLPDAEESEKKRIAEGVLKLLPYLKCVCEIKSVKGEFRQPETALLAGSRTETIHTENGVRYHIDVSKTMFSKGNVFERQRLIGKIRKGETVVDMFAGIGYFSLPIARHTEAGKIVAIEKNLDAFRFLKDGIKLNGATNIDAVWGDCRDFAESVKDFADRVIMGYLPGTEAFLPQAIAIAKSGAAVHFHNIYGKKHLWKKPVADIENACRQQGCKYKVLGKRKVKSYRPNVFHVVVDFQVMK